MTWSHALFFASPRRDACIGFFAGMLVVPRREPLFAFLVFLALGLIRGINELKDSLYPKMSKKHHPACSYRLLFVHGTVATSIDCLAVGFGFGACLVKTSSLPPSLSAQPTICACFAGIWIGKKFGNLLGRRAELLGGVTIFCSSSP
jgi:putative Mn2+ efflux pump MntP